MTQLAIEMDQSEIAKVRLMLGAISPMADRVIQQSVNRTLTGVRTDSTNEVAKVITPTKTSIRKTISVSRMMTSGGIAAVKCTGGPLNLINFKARQTKKGVTVQVLKSGGRSLIKHAFIQTMKNGKKLVMWRVTKNGRMVPRYPIRALPSFRVPDVMGYPKTMKEILRLGGERLTKNLNDRLNYELSKI